jgi:chromosomal replication initiation ATPase DnaA
MNTDMKMNLEELVGRVAELEKVVAKLTAEAPPLALAPTAHRTVLNIVAQHSQITPPQIMGVCRQMEIVWARWVAWHLLRTRFGWTQLRIGRAFGKDHSCVGHAISRLPLDRKNFPRLDALLQQTEKDLDAMMQTPTTP